MASEFTVILGGNMENILWDILRTLVLILWQYWFQQISQYEIDSHYKYTIISIILVPNIIYILRHTHDRVGGCIESFLLRLQEILGSNFSPVTDNRFLWFLSSSWDILL